ncbi:serine protease [Sulfuricurvum sp.]|uniref:S1 family peptidase n=1 Tax=Sulfuricurvum sp. TaxID=2025608 RepID=UPI00260E97EF|nr:serine protease [Sulfuricurvum sp.]MDD4950590.1 serine protease [Sulfuricurvum sp.]
MHRVEITAKNAELAEMKLEWGRPAFTSDDGIGSLDSLHQVSNSIVSISGFFGEKLQNVGSGIIIGPGMLLTATHVLKEFPTSDSGPVFLSYLPEGKARAWLPTATVTCSGPSKNHSWDKNNKIVSDLSIVSCDLHSEAHLEYPLSLIPMELCLPLPGTRLWAIGFRNGTVEGNNKLLTPLISSGLVTNCFPHGRGERMPSPCIEVNMETYGGMSGGPVFNEDGRLVGIVSSSFDGGPSYITLIWDSLRLGVEGLPNEVWPDSSSGIMEGVDLGLIRVKGKYKVDSKRNVTVTLSDEEMSYFSPGEFKNDQE